MCGIVAIYNYNKSNEVIDAAELQLIQDKMTARGPDGCGQWYSSDRMVGLGHRRLSIIDLSIHASQPMTNEDGSSAICYNGEIYNYRELRAVLKKKGYRFKSTSDTEVLLHLYAEKGRAMVHDLRGMFAFALWDNEKKALFMARDPFGIKPLYYADNGRTIRVASQVKALLTGGKIDTSEEPAGHVGFFLWGYVPEPYTLYHGIRTLPAGSYMWIDAGGHKSIRNYCNIRDVLAEAHQIHVEQPEKSIRDELRESLLDSVRHHLVADVPVGVFLSSGLDSATLTALAAEIQDDRVHTVTLGFAEYRDTSRDEAPLAEVVARRYGTKHQTVWVTRENFKSELESLLQAMDQPTIDGVNTYFVSRAAAQTGLKVILSGLGGDELFGGYESFHQIPRMVRMLSRWAALPCLGKTFRLCSAPFLKRLTSPKYASLFEYGGNYGGAYLLRRGLFMPWELPAFLDGELVREGWRELQSSIRLEKAIQGIETDRLKISALEIQGYMRNQLLRDSDWAGMAHSLEIRVPFVDIELLRAIGPLLAQENLPGKQDMALTPTHPLPSAILNRGKTGFSIPVQEWLKDSDHPTHNERGLRGWAKEVYKTFG